MDKKQADIEARKIFKERNKKADEIMENAKKMELGKWGLIHTMLYLKIWIEKQKKS